VRTVPLRSPAQLRQLQFHCGNPPPAADPSTRIFMALRITKPAEAGFVNRKWRTEPAEKLPS